MPRRSPRTRPPVPALTVACDLAPDIEASRLLGLIGTDEAREAIGDLAAAGDRRAAALRGLEEAIQCRVAALRRASAVILAAIPTPATEH